MTTTREGLLAELAMPAIEGTEQDIAQAAEIHADLTEWVLATMHQLGESAARLAARGNAKAEKIAAARAALITVARRATSARWLIDFRQSLTDSPAGTLADLADADDRRAVAAASLYWTPRRDAYAAIAEVTNA